MTTCLLALVLMFDLTSSQKALIADKVWFNECRGTVSGLTSWNEGEEFPSLGIGHFIWYPSSFRGPYHESFPDYVRFAQSLGAKPPRVALQPTCPWESKAQFKGPELDALQSWLAETVELQAEFLAQRGLEALPRILENAPDRERLRANYQKVASTPTGVYALIDYVNFKGEGTEPKERYKGQGWGLLWVLREMKDVGPGVPAAVEFGEAAKRCLDRRIENSPPARGESRWKLGWHKRCQTYQSPLRTYSASYWGSQNPDLSLVPRQTPDRIVVHHAGLPWVKGSKAAEKVRRLQSWSIAEKGWKDLPYHFLVAPDGQIFEGRDPRYQGVSNTDYPLNGALQVQLFGDFEAQALPRAQRRALERLLAFLCARYQLAPQEIFGHGEVAPNQTACPGRNLREPLPEIRAAVQRELGGSWFW